MRLALCIKLSFAVMAWFPCLWRISINISIVKLLNKPWKTLLHNATVPCGSTAIRGIHNSASNPLQRASTWIFMPLKQPNVASHPSVGLGDGRGRTITNSAHNYCHEWGHSGLWMGALCGSAAAWTIPGGSHTGTLHGDKEPVRKHGVWS